MCEMLKEILKNTAKEGISEIKSSLPDNNETWWRDKKIQRKVVRKKNNIRKKNKPGENCIEYKNWSKHTSVIKSAVNKRFLMNIMIFMRD